MVKRFLFLAFLFAITTSGHAFAGEKGKAAITPTVESLLSSAGLLDRDKVDQAADRSASAAEAFAQSEAAAPLQSPDPQVAGLIVRFRSSEAKRLSRENLPPPEDLIAEISELAGTELRFLRAMSLDSFVFRFPQPLGSSEAQLIIDRIKSSPHVEWVEPDVVMKPMLAPNDTHLSYQWNLGNPLSYPGSVNLFPAWDITRGSPSTVVAVVDTGVRSHPEFGSRLLPGYDFVSDIRRANDGNARDADPMDPGTWGDVGECDAATATASSWHGTHVTGIIAAAGNNFAGVAGINWNTRILPVRVLGKCGFGLHSDIVDGLLWAAGIEVPGTPTNLYAAHVINASLGGAYPGGCSASILYSDAINRIKAKGALLVVAAGNSDEEAAGYIPASCKGVITVGAVDKSGYRARYSNYSLKYKVTVSAPGGDNLLGWDGAILSTWNTGKTSPGSDDYGFMYGTSMAAPHVAGIASLALATDPLIASELLEVAMEYTSRAFPASSSCASISKLCGEGIVDAYKTLAGVNALKPYTLVHEFYNVGLNHYFRTGDKGEAAFVLNGGAGTGWLDSQDYFLAWRDGSQGAVPVCRFYGTPGIGPNSHFYTADAGECAFVKKDPGWTYEGIAFYAMLPFSGVCATNTTPIYRLYNNRWAQNDSNHRFTTDDTVVNAMIGQGWIYEGVVMCAVGS